MIALAMALVLAPMLSFQAPQTAPAAQAASLHADMLRDWQSQRDKLMKTAEAMPPDKFAFKPKPELRTWAEQLTHIAGNIVSTMKRLDPSASAPTVPQNATSKADAVKALGDAFEFGVAVLKKETDASLLEGVQGPPYYGPGLSTHARLVYRTIQHTEDEYGVMTVYLRLNGIVPPASQR